VETTKRWPLPGKMPLRNPPRIPRVSRQRLREIRRWLERNADFDRFAGAKGPRCPWCPSGGLHRSDDLTAEWVGDGERILLMNLKGYRCDGCGRSLYDRRSELAIGDMLVATRQRNGYTATVSSLGGGKLGIYLPKEAIKALRFAKYDELRIVPLSRTRAFVEKVEG